MNRLTRRIAAAAAVALAFGSTAAAQTADSTSRRQQRTLDSLTSALRAMQARLDSLTRARARGDTTVVDELAALRAAANAAAGDSAAAAPRQARLGQNALNPEISVSGDLRGNWYGEGPQTDNFVAREFEFSFQSALDPFSVAKVFLAVGDGEVELEEGYVYWTGLPGHGRLDAGRFRQTFGELNRWHLHAVPADEYPLVIRRFAGDEGLAGTGLSVYWPLPFSGLGGTYELTIQGTTNGNDVLFAGGNRLSLSSQLSAFWQLSRSTFAQLSVSGIYGTNPDTSLKTTAGALAARYSWRPPDRSRTREFTVRTEFWALRRAFALAAPDDFSRTRVGAYTDLSWRLDARWVLGARGDWVQSPEPGPFATEWAMTPSITYWQSEFVYLRALFEHARLATGETTNRLGIRAVLAMGPHKHELF